jgi:hypothetical protein
MALLYTGEHSFPSALLRFYTPVHICHHAIVTGECENVFSTVFEWCVTLEAEDMGNKRKQVLNVTKRTPLATVLLQEFKLERLRVAMSGCCDVTSLQFALVEEIQTVRLMNKHTHELLRHTSLFYHK